MAALSLPYHKTTIRRSTLPECLSLVYYLLILNPQLAAQLKDEVMQAQTKCEDLFSLRCRVTEISVSGLNLSNNGKEKNLDTYVIKKLLQIPNPEERFFCCSKSSVLDQLNWDISKILNFDTQKNVKKRTGICTMYYHLHCAHDT